MRAMQQADEAWIRGSYNFDKTFGFADGMRIPLKSYLNNINSLRGESVGFQPLSLRHKPLKSLYNF